MSAEESETTVDLDGALRDAIRALTADDVRAFIDYLPPDDRPGLAHALGVHADSRFIRGGLAPLLVTKLRMLPSSGRVFGAGLFAARVLSRLMDIAELDPWMFADIEPNLEALAAQFSPGLLRVTAIYAALQADEDEEVDLQSLLDAIHRLRPSPLPTASTAAPNGEDESEAALPEEDASLFTALDILLIRTSVASFNEQIGAPAPDDMSRILDEVLRLNAERRSSYFHIGFISALRGEEPDVPEAGLNEERRLWLRFGRLNALIRRDATSDIVSEVRSNEREVLAVLRHDTMARVVAPRLIEALLGPEPGLAARMLQTHQLDPWVNGTTLTLAYERSRSLLIENRAKDAEALLGVLQSADWKPENSETDPNVDLTRRLAACRRSAEDFHGASELLDDIEVANLDAKTLALLEAERGLIASRVGHLGHIRFPRKKSEVEPLVARLQRGEQRFLAALELDEDEVRSNYCLGVLAWCREDHANSERLLERSEVGMGTDPVFQELGLLATVKFHRALSLLMTMQPGTDGPAYKGMRDGVLTGYVPTREEWADALDALSTHGSRHTTQWLALAVENNQSSNLVETAVSLASSGDKMPRLVALDLASARSLGAKNCYRLLDAVVTGALAADDRTVLETALQEIDNVLVQARSKQIDIEWATRLARDDSLRMIMGADDADLTRLELLRECGEMDEARAIVEPLFHRCVHGGLPHYSPADLLEVYEELGASEQDIRRLAGSLALAADLDDTTSADTLDGRALKLVFVGGNETQARYKDPVNRAIHDAFSGLVTIDWHFPGWGADWAETAAQVEKDFDHTDGLVLMSLVRTNLGRRLRRTAGEHGVPWIPCTGRGRGSIERSIRHAIRVCTDRAT